MRLLVVTTRFPTPDRPAAGAFVRDRLLDPDIQARVVAPRRYDRSRVGRYMRLWWDALTTRGRFDGIEGHFVLPAGPAALVAARLRRRPLVVYAHGGDVRDAIRSSGSRRWLARRVIRGAAVVVANSTETAARVAELGGKAEVVSPGIDLTRFSPSPRPATGSVLYVGGDVPHKGVAVARELATSLVGPGIREVAPDEIPALLAAHDVLLMPSIEEPFGLAAVEAIAAGRWVVAAAVGGLAGIVTDGLNGTLVTDGDYAAALATVPDYDPAVVAASAKRFGIEHHWAAMRAVWARATQGVSGG
jgi:phosphatidylinositol alpha-1,6-mannosyltransferase